MSAMERADGTDHAERNVEGIKQKTFGTKPYLDKSGREILNRAGRHIQRKNPDWCDSPEEPSASDCLVQLQQGAGGFTDTGLIVELLGRGLDAQEAVVWVLWKHSNLDPKEIFYAHEGKQTAGRSGVDDQALRNIKSRIRSASMKLGVEVDI